MSGLDTPDRRVLETVILPAFASRPEVRRVLFVGCAEYTRDYEGHFAGRGFYTIDVDPARAPYGATAPGRHLVDSVENAGRHFRPASLDLILINGVFGYGLDERDRAEAAVASCHDLLAGGGTLMIGWNDLPQCKPFDPVALNGMGRFVRVEFPGLTAVAGVRRLREGDYLVDDKYQHVFSFFEKPAQGPAPGLLA